MNQEPAESAYDIHFRVLGFPTRVTWGFWVAAIVIGWSSCQSWDENLSDSPGAPALLIVWAAAMFVSILVHELGHAMTMQYYGMQSRMVLYHFGGLAISNNFGSWNGARRSSLSARDSLLISAAGPAAQLALAVIVYAIGRYLGVWMELDGILQYFFSIEPPIIRAQSSALTYAAFNAIVTPSVFWALLNLLPIIPMDGGNIMRNVLVLSKNPDAQRNAHLISIFFAALVAMFCFQNGETMIMLMCLALAAINWQQLQIMSGRF